MSESNFDPTGLFEGTGTGFLGFLAKKLGEGAAKVWENVKFRQAALAYTEKMQRLYGTLNILGKGEPVPLKDVFTDVYILEELSALRRFDLQRVVEDDSVLQHKTRHNGLTVVKHFNKRRLFILGKPGAGKTTFLKYITLQALKGEIAKIPMFVDLKVWASKNCSLLDYLVQQFDICNFPDARPWIEYHLEQGNALVLLDGLDEVQQEGRQRDRIIQEANDFVKKYLNSQYLVTCRIAATDYRMELFTYMEVADFTDDQIREYVKRWFCKMPIEPEKFLEEFDKPEHGGLRDLARTPLLLNLLCLHFEQNLRFSNKREEIYEDAFDALLRRWDAHRGIRRDEIYRKLTPNRKKQLFAQLAYDTFAAKKLFFKQSEIAEKITKFLQKLPPVDIEEDIDGEGVLKAIEAQHGILTERAYKIYGFSHKTFQEYFTAKYIVENPQRVVEMVNTRLLDDNWREVFLLVASLLDDATLFVTQFRQGIDEIIKTDNELIKRLNWAHQKALTIDSTHKISAIRISYITLAIAVDRALALDRSVNLDLAIALVLDLDLNLALDLDLARALARDLDFALDLAFDRSTKLPIDLKIDFLLGYSLLFSKIFVVYPENILISKFQKFFEETHQQCQYISSLQQKLQLTVPTDIRWKTWKRFSEQLQIIVRQERNMGHEWKWTESQLETIDRYFRANLLLLECMKVAVLDKKLRQEIENSLFLPPS